MPLASSFWEEDVSAVSKLRCTKPDPMPCLSMVFFRNWNASRSRGPSTSRDWWPTISARRRGRSHREGSVASGHRGLRMIFRVYFDSTQEGIHPQSHQTETYQHPTTNRSPRVGGLLGPKEVGDLASFGCWYVLSLGLQPHPFRRWLGWVPGGSNHLLRIWLEP